MCGICGSYSKVGSNQRMRVQLENANSKLSKRGPDGGAVFLKGSVGLGHRRLSIIDVTCAGDQPMTTIDGRYTIVFNGEIFNYKELRDLLTDEEKSSLRSTSDTEIFLVLYARMGTDVFVLLRGFYAAAIYDDKSDSLVIVRDRFGKKPLLIYQDKESLHFASEMKALLEFGIPKSINWNILQVYLQLNYIPQPYSILENVSKLEPGHFMTVTKDSVSTLPYFDFAFDAASYKNLDYEDAKKQLIEKVEEAVKVRLVSDVPLGAFLSGGIDSSVIVAMASRNVSKLNTFSIGYKDNKYFDETRYAELVAKMYKTEHTVFSLSNNDFLEHVQDVLDYIDEPFADSSAIPQYILSSYTKKYVTVALSGDGGDEVFAGYNKHRAEYRMRQGGLLNTIVKAGLPLWSVLPKSRNNRFTNIIRQLNRFAEGARYSPSQRYWRWASFLDKETSTSFLNESIQNKLENGFVEELELRYSSHIKGTDFNEVLFADMNLVLLSDMLVKVDMMSMANSLEVRSPFLDQNVVEFSFQLDASYKIDDNLKKKLIQDAFRPFLPDELYNRPKKGFEIPLLGWFRNELWGLINDDLLSEKLIREQGIFNPLQIEQLKKKLLSNDPGDSHATIWAILVFQNWYRRYISG